MYINYDIDWLRFCKDKKIILFGCGKIGKRVYGCLKSCGLPVAFFCDNASGLWGGKMDGVEVISFEQLKKINSDEYWIIIANTYIAEVAEQLLSNGIHNYCGYNQIDLGGENSAFYEKEYFDYQRQIGEFGAVQKLPLFNPYIKKNMTVVEFGAGGGYLLKLIDAKEKIGIEINEAARKQAEQMGIKEVRTIAEIPNNYADIIISTSALEHVENPFGVIKELREKLKENGTIVFHVPNESCDTEYKKSDINNHLYTWNAMNLGNLFKTAGYFVKRIENIGSQWTNNYMSVRESVGQEVYDELCTIRGQAFKNYMLLIVAVK